MGTLIRHLKTKVALAVNQDRDRSSRLHTTYISFLQRAKPVPDEWDVSMLYGGKQDGYDVDIVVSKVRAPPSGHRLVEVEPVNCLWEAAAVVLKSCPQTADRDDVGCAEDVKCRSCRKLGVDQFPLQRQKPRHASFPLPLARRGPLTPLLKSQSMTVNEIHGAASTLLCLFWGPARTEPCS